MTWPAVTITTLYDESTPRRIVAVRYRCQACGQEWDDPHPDREYTTSSHYDRQVRSHTCPDVSDLKGRP